MTMSSKSVNQMKGYGIMTTTKNEIEQVALEMRKAYYKEWRQKNKAKVKDKNNNYWLKKAEKKLAESNAHE